MFLNEEKNFESGLKSWIAPGTSFAITFQAKKCLRTLLPNLNNTETLNLEHLGIKQPLNKLSCDECRICIYLRITDDDWVHIDAILQKNKIKNGWETISGKDDLIRLYILSQIMYNEIENQSDEDVFFDFPDENDLVKILWVHGNAVGYYSVKRKESLVFDTMESYQITTLDTAYIRKSYRGKGLGISILNDIVMTFPDEDIGLSTPVSLSMYHVVCKFLKENPSYKTKLWETSGVGAEGDRKLIYFTLKKIGLLGH